MFEQHAGSHTHNLLNRARGGTLLCTRGPCPLVPLASYGPVYFWVSHFPRGFLLFLFVGFAICLELTVITDVSQFHRARQGASWQCEECFNRRQWL